MSSMGLYEFVSMSYKSRLPSQGNIHLDFLFCCESPVDRVTKVKCIHVHLEFSTMSLLIFGTRVRKDLVCGGDQLLLRFLIQVDLELPTYVKRSSESITDYVRNVHNEYHKIILNTGSFAIMIHDILVSKFVKIVFFKLTEPSKICTVKDLSKFLMYTLFTKI